MSTLLRQDSFERFRMDERIALVTGASSGLGEHFSLVLASAGARVALCARRVEKLEAVVARIRAAGGEARALHLDVGDASSIHECLNALANWGTPDVVVNNAGVTVTKPALEQSEAEFDQVLDTNLKGSWLMSTEAARRMVQAGKGGSIVNVASILGERVAAWVAPYAISKAALIQATKALALEWARHNIRVNALLPGYVKTDINEEFLESLSGQALRRRIPSRRFGELNDFDGALLLLVSDAGAAITGACLPVDGGHLVSSL